jgi:type II secretory pathway pseudopilin PulG
MNTHGKWTRRMLFGITGDPSIASVIVTMVVIIVVILLAMIIYPNLYTAIQSDKSSRTYGSMTAIGTALGSYLVDYDHLPASTTDVFATLDNLGYYSGTTKDGWGREFHYHSEDGTTYTLLSYGKDGKKGGCDEYEWGCDIVYINGRFVAPARFRQ